MDPQRYQHIKSVLLEAMEQPIGARDRWLAQRCGGDVALRREVEELLAGEDQQSFMEHSPLPLTIEQETDASGSRLGFYSFSNCQIDRELLGEVVTNALPRHPIPAVLLGRLAVDKREQGKQSGTWLLMDALKRTVLVGQQSGVFALVVDAADAKARDFYLRHGFLPITDRPLTLYLPLETGLRAMRAVQPGNPS